MIDEISKIDKLLNELDKLHEGFKEVVIALKGQDIDRETKEYIINSTVYMVKLGQYMAVIRDKLEKNLVGVI